jgi:hypothetical protein
LKPDSPRQRLQADERREGPEASIRPALTEAAAEKNLAWEEIAAGRFMPRRTRGSFPGRELG